uniref:Glyoxalase/fosfomycin resistance/dioxygenase domain-containing protein n=1 Tax=Mucochytrium quahogii TaxID=96639 RepID=A0A7S2RR76_9STRA|mmetsp:Transcript_15067/g.24481  ORF Transcript_15067/g.24481 Transcript_15067/m.24481 type:complete len:126 (+) Transcript_15067:3-380(+)
MIRFRRVLVLTRDVGECLNFYGSEGLGLRVRFASDSYAEFDCGDKHGTTFALQKVEREAECSTGYSPMLHFDVEDMDSLIGRLIMLGGRLDGPIKYPVHGKLASLRSPNGQMIGLFERNVDLPEE